MPSSASPLVLSDRVPLVHIAAWEVPSDPGPAVAAALGESARVGRLPGFAGAAWLTRRRDLHPVRRDSDVAERPAERIVELVQWTTGADADAGGGGVLGRVAAARGVPGGELTCRHGGAYTLRGIVTPSGSSRLAIDQEGVTLILLGTSEDAAKALDYLMAAAREEIRFIPGFVGGAFLLSADGRRLTEVIRWASPEAFRDATADERFRRSLGSAGSYVKVNGGSYRIQAVHAPTSSV